MAALFHRIGLVNCLAMTLAFYSVSAQALELRLGRGDFAVGASLQGLMSADFSLDVTTLSLAQSPLRIPNTPLALAMRLDYFDSEYMNQVTDFASQGVQTDIPFLGQSIDDVAAQFVPVPADYRIHGVNLDASLSYRAVDKSSGYFDVGINTGLTFPFMKTRNMRSDANLFFNLLERFSTELRSYKIGPALAGEWRPAAALAINYSLVMGYQTAQLDNTALGSGVGIDGRYRSWSLAARWLPSRVFSEASWLNQSFIVLGYQASRWDYDKTMVELIGVNYQVPTLLDMDFAHDSLYVGVGFNF